MAIQHSPHYLKTRPLLLATETTYGELSSLGKQAGFIPKAVRDAIFLPLNLLLGQELTTNLARETTFYKNFWNKRKPKDPNFHDQKAIRAGFLHFDQPIHIINGHGDMVKVKLRIIESKEPEKRKTLDRHNVLLIQGNLHTLNNHISAYAFLSSYLKDKKANPGLPPLRVIVFSHYDNTFVSRSSTKEEPYKPPSLDILGRIVKKSIESLNSAYGRIHTVAAYSLGCLTLAATLKHMQHDPIDTLPHTFFLDRGPSSIYETSKNYWGGKLLYLAASYSGWSLNVDHELVRFFNAIKTKVSSDELKKFHLIVSEVAQDFYFPGRASLAQSHVIDCLQDSINLLKLTFAPHLQSIHPRAQHAWGSHHLNHVNAHNKPTKKALRPHKHLAGAVMHLASKHFLTVS